MDSVFFSRYKVFIFYLFSYVGFNEFFMDFFPFHLNFLMYLRKVFMIIFYNFFNVRTVIIFSFLFLIMVICVLSLFS